MNPRSNPRSSNATNAISTISLAVMLAIGVAYIAPAHAQATPTTPAKKDEAAKADDGKLEKITVTAQRREQELQAVPLPVSTFSAADLQSRGITSTRAIADFTPNMVGQNNTGLGTANVYFIRGLGNTESIATFDPPVGTYVNDVYVSRQNANNFGFFDVERVEVLRGPQGTLFGRNTTGGAINVILKKPGAKLGGYAEFGVGRFGQTSVRASIDAPVSDDFRTKFSFFKNDDDGYVDNITTGERLNAASSNGFRGAFQWRLGGGVIWDLAVDSIQDSGTNVYNGLVDGRRVSTTGFRTDYPGFFSATGAPLTSGAKNTFGLGNNVDNQSVTSNVGISFGALSVDFISGWRDLTQQFALDFIQNPLPGGGYIINNDARNTQFTQEVKATGDAFGSKMTYVVGGFYMREKNVTDFGDIFRSGANLIVLGDRTMRNTTQSTAFYAQADYKITNTLTGTVGVRNTKDDKSIEFQDNRPITATTNLSTRLTTANIQAAGNATTQNTNYTTPRFALSYQMNPDVMMFASATRGYKAGGWSSRSTTPAAMQPFAPETVWSYEAGWRTSWMGNRVRFNGTVFFMDVSQLQTVSAVTLSTGAVSFLQKNFADLKNQGLELELTASLRKGFITYLNIGLQDAEYRNLAREVVTQQADCRAGLAPGGTSAQRGNCNQGIVTASGDISIPVRVPKKTINPGVTWSVPFDQNGLEWSTTVNLSYTSKMAAATNNSVFSGGHTVINASTSLFASKNNWRLTLDCTNCSDKTWVTAQLAGFNYLPEPRRVALRALMNFK